jgi:peroxiredoxin Q/BCP
MSASHSHTLTVGAPAPEFSLPAANRPGVFALATLLSASNNRPLVVEFLRGTWCPNCVKRMRALEAHREQIEALGGLVYIAAEKLGGLFKPEEYLAAHPVSFPFLLDEDRSITRAWGVYLPFSYDSIRIARPATFVVDAAANIRYIHVGGTQFDRAPVHEVIQALQTVLAA